MKRMTYKTLMKKVREGQAEVFSWAGDYAEVCFYKSNGTRKREFIEVIYIPADFKR